MFVSVLNGCTLWQGQKAAVMLLIASHFSQRTLRLWHIFVGTMAHTFKSLIGTRSVAFGCKHMKSLSSNVLALIPLHTCSSRLSPAGMTVVLSVLESYKN